jgi:hypothetical protein
MAPSHRRLPDQGAEQLRARARTRIAVLVIAVVTLSLTLLTHGHRLADAGRSTLRVPALELMTWMSIAGDLEDRVPARLLLGGTGANEALDNLLAARGVRRADFQRAASTAVRRVGETMDALAGEAILAAFAVYPLPEGIEIPDSHARAPADRSSELEEARRLVLTLTARLEAPVPETETL